MAHLKPLVLFVVFVSLVLTTAPFAAMSAPEPSVINKGEIKKKLKAIYYRELFEGLKIESSKMRLLSEMVLRVSKRKEMAQAAAEKNLILISSLRKKLYDPAFSGDPAEHKQVLSKAVEGYMEALKDYNTVFIKECERLSAILAPEELADFLLRQKVVSLKFNKAVDRTIRKMQQPREVVAAD